LTADRTGDDNDAADEPTSVTDATPATAGASDPAAPAATGTTQVVPGAPLLGEPVGFQLAIVAGGTRFLDLDTGVVRAMDVTVHGATDFGLLVTDLRGPGPQTLAVWPAPYDGSGETVLSDALEAPWETWISGNGQHVWALGGKFGELPELVHYDLVAQTSSTIQLGPSSPVGVVNDALLVGANGGTYRLGSDGGFDRISTGSVVVTGADRVVVEVCDEQLSCELQAIDQDGRPIGDYLPLDRTDFDSGTAESLPPIMAPDGRLAWVRGEGASSSVLLVDGEEVGRLLSPALLAWSPDGRWLFAVDRGEPGGALIAIEPKSRERIALYGATEIPEFIVAFRTPA
jgi:hypothetical protein